MTAWRSSMMSSRRRRLTSWPWSWTASAGVCTVPVPEATCVSTVTMLRKSLCGAQLQGEWVMDDMTAHRHAQSSEGRCGQVRRTRERWLLACPASACAGLCAGSAGVAALDARSALAPDGTSGGAAGATEATGAASLSCRLCSSTAACLLLPASCGDAGCAGLATAAAAVWAVGFSRELLRAARGSATGTETFSTVSGWSESLRDPGCCLCGTSGAVALQRDSSLFTCWASFRHLFRTSCGRRRTVGTAKYQPGVQPCPFSGQVLRRNALK